MTRFRRWVTWLRANPPYEESLGRVHGPRDRADRREGRHGGRVRGRRGAGRPDVPASQWSQLADAAAVGRDAGALPAVRAVGDGREPHGRLPRLGRFRRMAQAGRPLFRAAAAGGARDPGGQGVLTMRNWRSAMPIALALA